MVKGQNINNVRANITKVKSENLARNIEKHIFYATGEGKAFKGLNQFITDGIGTLVEADALTYEGLCEVIDAVPYGSAVYMNSKTMRIVEKVLKEEGYKFGSIITDGGRVLETLNNKPIYTSENIADNDIFVVEFSDQGCGLLALGEPIEVVDMGLLDSMPVYRTMINGTMAPVVRQKRALAKFQIKDTTTPPEESKKGPGRPRKEA